MAASEDALSPEEDDLGQELMLRGEEQLLRGSDTGVLVAFAVIAFEGLTKEKGPYYTLTFGLLLFSVLLCAFVHVTVGNAYVTRGRNRLRGSTDKGPRAGGRRIWTAIACGAGVLQLLCILAALVLVFLR